MLLPNPANRHSDLREWEDLNEQRAAILCRERRERFHLVPILQVSPKTLKSHPHDHLPSDRELEETLRQQTI